MTQTKFEYLYWDASVFLAYLNGEPGRVDTIEALLDQVSRSRTAQLATASLTIVEVVHAATAGQRSRLSPAQEAQIDDLLNASFVRLIDTSRGLYYQARTLMRSGLEQGWSLRAKDAIHLVTAAWLHQQVGTVTAVHTYDGGWQKYCHLVGGLTITEPYLPQPPLPFRSTAP